MYMFVLFWYLYNIHCIIIMYVQSPFHWVWVINYVAEVVGMLNTVNMAGS